MKKPLIEILKEVGLSENESRTYLSSLSLGPTTVKKIANTSGIKRTTVYSVIESLQEKGLMKISIEGFKKKYIAESPEKLERIIEQRKETFQKQLPEFISLYKAPGDSNMIKQYKGKEAVKSVYEENLKDIKPGEDYMVISNSEKVFTIYGKWFEKFVEKRSKLDIRTRMILQDTPATRDYKKYERNFNIEVRFLPKKSILETNLVITPQRVLIHQLDDPISGIVLENKNAIQTNQELFEVLWESCKNN